jgi:hypothetical protein
VNTWLACLAVVALASISSAQDSKPKPAATFVIPPDINGLKTVIPPPAAAKPLRGGIFDGKGAPDDGINHVINVREFVREGGGYCGICAGAYLACSNFSWGSRHFQCEHHFQ